VYDDHDPDLGDETMNATLKADLVKLVALSKLSGNAVDYLYERLRRAESQGDRRAIQQIRLAITHAERNAS
jgi:hypothetical protein